MSNLRGLETTACTPLMLRRIREIPEATHPTASSMTVVTTQGARPEMHDQQEDATRYDKD